MTNKFIVLQVFVAVFCSCLAQQELMADTISTKQDTSVAKLLEDVQKNNDVRSICRVDLACSNLDDVDIGHVVFGTKQTKKLFVINCPESLDIIAATLEGCSSCSDVQIRRFSKIHGESKAYQFDLVFNKKKVFPSDTIYKKTIHLRGSDGTLRFKFNISYRVVPNCMTDPNSLLFEKATPEVLYSVVLRKKNEFTAASIQIPHEKLKLANWQDQQNQILLSFKSLHTLEDTKINSWIKIATLQNEVFYVPLILFVREHVTVKPKLVYLGSIRRGETKSKLIRIQCDKEFELERVGDTESDIHFELVNTLPKCKEFRLSFENNGQEAGIIRKEFMFRVVPYDEVISLPVYVVIVK